MFHLHCTCLCHGFNIFSTTWNNWTIVIAFLLLLTKPLYGYNNVQSSTAPSFQTVQGIPVHRVPLRYTDPHSAYALAVTNDPTISCSTARQYNFLATQVWPSARTAALALEQRLLQHSSTDRPLVLCEFGCGPGLPSIAAALHGAASVVATDVDELALSLVQQAASEQGLSDRVQTRVLDLTDPDAEIPLANLYLFSDVFENAAVAQGAALITARICSSNNEADDDPPCVWVMAQSDRSERETFLRELRRLLDDSSLTWSSFTATTRIPPPVMKDSSLPWNGRLWLCDIDETNVFYGV